MYDINKLLGLICFLLLIFIGQKASASPRYEPVTGFDINRYLGKWYEIARMPVWFEKGLVNVTATYSLMDDGKVKVVNAGHKNTKDGKIKVANGKAKFGNSTDRGYFRVTFFWPFYGDYIIVDLDPDYRYAVVASSPEYLWILSREPKMEKELLNSLVEKAKKLGFDTDKLYFTPQEW